MRILFVIHTPKVLETAIYIGYSARQKYFQAKGWAAEILSPDDFPIFKSLYRFIPLLYPFFVARYLCKKKGQYDLVLFHSYSGWVFNLLRKMTTPCKTVTVFHGLEPLFFKNMEEENARQGIRLSLKFRLFYCFFLSRTIKFSCRRSDALFCLNREEKKILEEKHYQTSDKIHLMANEVDECFYVRRQEYAPVAKRLLFVGQWLMMKGVDYLALAFSKIAKEFPDVRLRLVGTLRTEEEVKKSFPPECRGRIEVFPRVTREEISRHYFDSDLFIQTTLFEAFGRTLSEAMASALPVVTTPAGFAEVIRNGENGILVSFRDPEALASAVGRLVPDQALRKKLGTAALETLQPYRAENILEQWFQACSGIFAH